MVLRDFNMLAFGHAATLRRHNGCVEEGGFPCRRGPAWSMHKRQPSWFSGPPKAAQTQMEDEERTWSLRITVVSA